MNQFLKLYFFAYRNSMGDVNVPDSAYWQRFADAKNYNEGVPPRMVFAMWFVWWFNNLYMVVILLNFLISIVGEAHADALQKEQETLYNQKSEYNQEMETMIQLFRMLAAKFVPMPEEEKDLFVIAANFEEEGEHQVDDVISNISAQLTDFRTSVECQI